MRWKRHSNEKSKTTTNMKELRDIKIDQLTGSKNPIVDLFCQITAGMKIINCDVYNKDGLEFIYFVPEKNEWIFYQDAKKDKFWCNFATYWSFFESKLGLEYLEIQAITKHLVEDALKREVVTPYMYWKRNAPAVEDALKREVATPPKLKNIKQSAVEEALKRELATPNSTLHLHLIGVDEALKRELAPDSENPAEP